MLIVAAQLSIWYLLFLIIRHFWCQSRYVKKGIPLPFNHMLVHYYNVTDARITNKWVNTVWADLRSHHFKNPAILVSVNSVASIISLIYLAVSTIIASIVHSKLDYCNSLYYSLSKSQISHLQQTQTSLIYCSWRFNFSHFTHSYLTALAQD